MYLKLSKNYRAVSYGSQIILLNLLTNEYQGLEEEASSALLMLLQHPNSIFIEDIFLNHKDNKWNLKQWTEEFLKEGLIESDANPSQSIIDKPVKKGGIKDYTWVLQKTHATFANISKIDFILSIWILIKINWIIKKKGISGIIQLLEKKKNSTQNWQIPTPEQLKLLMGALENSCLYFPKKTVCLLWSASLTYLCLKKGWQAQFVVGIQLHPFLAHAWVEQGNQVIGDRSDINQYLGIFLKAPNFKPFEIKEACLS